MRTIRKAAVAIAIIGTLASTGCTVEQLEAWYLAHGVDPTSYSQPELEAQAQFATDWWEAAATTTTAPPPTTVAYQPRCVIPEYICRRESGFSYTALNRSSMAGGQYQFLPSTWNAVARAMGKPWLVGVYPHTATPQDQDEAAAWLWDGGRGCSHWSAC